MNCKLYNLRKALQYAILLWAAGFVWGIIVFMVPLLKNIQTVQFISKYPAVSIPLIIAYAALLFFLANRYLKGAGEKTAEAIKLGAVIFLVNIALDLAVYYFVFQSSDYFNYLSIWLSYGLMAFIPWLIGKRMS